MESKNRHVIGRRFVLERQERFSFETSERIYFNGHRLYQNPSLDAVRISSSSDDIEKIHRTRERVESLNNKINDEIERLKEFNNSLMYNKEERLMTWAERFRANPPLTNVLVPNKHRGPARLDDASKPGSKEVKQKDASPRKPLPNGLLSKISLEGLPPKEPSPKELPKELTLKITTSMTLPPKELPPKEPTQKKPLPRVLPTKEILPKGLSLKELIPRKPPPRVLAGKDIPPKGLPLNELNPRKPPSAALPAKERNPKWLPLKEFNSKKPTASVLPPKEVPLKGLPPKGLPPKGLPTKNFPPKGLPPKTLLPKGLPPKTLPPKGVPPKTIPPKGVPPKTLLPKGVPPKTIPPKGVPSKTLPPKGVPSKTLPPKGVPLKTIPPRGVPSKTLPPKGVPPKTILPKGVPLKTIPPRGVPPKTIPPKGVPPKTVFSKGVPPKEITLRKPPPKVIPPKDLPAKNLPKKDLPAKDLPAKRLPLKELPPKKTPPKAPMTRIAPSKISIQKELKPGKPPPKEVTPKKPISREEPVQGSLGDATPEELAARIKGGCCNFYCTCDQCCFPTFDGGCYIAADCNCNMGFNRGIQYDIPFCTARRRVTDLNTQDICSNRCVGISPDRKSSKQSNCIPRDKKKSPTRSRRISPANKTRNQEKLPKVESQKVQKAPNLKKRPDGPEKILKEKPPLKKDHQSTGETPKAPKTKVTKLDVITPIASPTKDQKIVVDEREYEAYLSSYYRENSKTDLQSPKLAPTYTRLSEGTARRDRTRGQLNSKQEQSISIRRDSQEVKPPILDQKIRESREHKASICLTESYPGPFSSDECFKDKDYRSPGNNKTDPVSDLQPIKSRAYIQHPKSNRSQDKDRQGVRPESVMEREVPKNVNGDRSSLSRDWQTDSTSYASLPVKRQSGTPSTRQASTTTETQRSKERSSLTYPLHSSEKSTQVYSGSPSSRKAHNPTTDSRQQSISSPISFREGSSRKAQSPTTDSLGLSNLTSRAGSSRKAQSPTTDSRQQSISSPISFREGSSRKTQSPTKDSRGLSNLTSGTGSSRKAQSPATDSRQQSNSSPISFGANSSGIAPSETTDTTRDTIVMNPHYQPEDSQSPYKHSSSESSHEGSKYDPMFDTQLLNMDVFECQMKHESDNPDENTTFEDAFSILSGKAAQSSNESLQVRFRQPLHKEFKDFQDSEMNEAEKHGSPSKQSKAKNLNQENDNEYKKKYYSSPTDDTQSRCECDGYETARSIGSSKHPCLLTGRPCSPDKSGDESRPIVETLCEKRTRTVTFKDQQGDLKKQRQVEEECRSHINWEQALNNRRHDDNYTSRSSSSAEHTCLESSCDEEDAYDSCFESPRWTDEQMPSFKACPCMYETYCQLAALCQTKSPYYR